ncbi:uncharacterized protein LOC121236548 [Juglans microcarpa x Juglans regia]|uniref:uncharacterized protein LOC121236548 n=1 Tax=Juglans microcarpa x Juglans regia TaxID=2249226 RepID=UPI001B7D9497|nr:uncharacterized protein LOC121236548 [Juglans microcarpa x Juglans regia]
MDAKLKGSPSFIWRSLWSSLGLLKEGLVQTPINTLDIETKVGALIDEDSNSWKIDLVETIFKEEEAKLICSIPISRSGASDRRIWASLERGNFSIKSAYFLETKLSNRSSGEPSTGGGNNSMWKDLWQLEVPAKAKLLIWKCLSNIRPTKDSLLRENIVESNLCPVCAREKETKVHVLWVCPAVADVWGGETSLFRKWKRFYPDFQQLWGEMTGKLNQESIELVVVLFYHIWARRNAYTFQTQFKNRATIVALAQADLSLLKEINLNSSNRAARSRGRGPSQSW